ncbi:MAG: efflux RND transporter periplasmic adaptor subunit [Phycisphaerales bacterium]|nr:efflux RND transporter periplasmic adaptor subunit [Phycisphaerales bacterium]
MLRKLILSCILIPTVLALALAIFSFLRATRPIAETLDPTRPPLLVNALQVWPTTVVPQIEGFGTARAERMAVLSAQVTGIVIARPAQVQPGAAVVAGDLLLRIDARDYEAQVARAQSLVQLSEASLRQLEVEDLNLQRLIRTAKEELALTEREYERMVDLFERGNANPREVDNARLAFQRARRALDTLEGERDLLAPRRAQEEASRAQRLADLTLATLNLARCEVHAPFSGQIASVSVEVGEGVGPGQPLLTLIDLTLIEVPIELPVTLRGRVTVGARATLQLERRSGARWDGIVARISPEASSASRTFQLFVEVQNRADSAPQESLAPGMFVRAELEGPRLADVLLVPRNAVRQGRVFLAADGRARGYTVEVVETLRDQAIVSGLTPGDIVLTSNLDALYDGMTVTPVLPTASAPAPLSRAARTP